MTEIAQVFATEGESLVAVLHPAHNNNSPRRAVLVVVGGPQYRVGSHRQFVLLARDLAAHGVPVLRFDYRSMGDSGGSERDFEAIEIDIRQAIDQLFSSLPSLEEVVIWGLCDAASAACFYAYKDERVKGLVLLNPWVRTEEGIAKAYLKHYYWSRLSNPDLWRKLFTGQFQFKASLISLFALLKSALGRDEQSAEPQDKPLDNSTSKTFAENSPAIISTAIEKSDSSPLPDRMLAGLNNYKGHVLLILSGDDLTADEFRDLLKASKKWQKCLKRAEKFTLQEANHTFSKRQWRDQVSKWTYEWVNSI